MVNHFYTLYRQWQEYKTWLIGAKLIACFSQQKDTLHFEWVSGRRQVLHMEFSARSAFPYWMTLRTFRRKKKNTVDFFKPLIGHYVVHTAIIPFDRTIGLDFGEPGYLILEFYGTPNAYYTDRQGFILQSFENPGEWNGRPHARFEILTKAFEHTELPLNLPEFPDITVMKDSLSRGALSFNKMLYLEWLFRAAEQQAQMDEKLAYHQALEEIFSELINGSPRIYIQSGEPVFLTSVRLKHPSATENELLTTFNEAVQRFVILKHQSDQEKEKRAALLKAVRRLIRKNKSLMNALEQDCAKAGQYKDWELRGRFLSAAFTQLRKGMTCITLPNPEQPDQPPVVIPLQPELSPQENIAAVFAKARKLRQSIGKITARLAEILRENLYLENLLHTLIDESPISGEELDKVYQNFIRRQWLIPEKKSSRPALHRPSGDELFKTYIISSRWKVWVARNDDKNELLTFTYARKDDYWFHARGYPGSHVVLRVDNPKENPPKNVLETAARLAAFFSKAKTSSMVPVIMTRKKYVRKMKHGKPGQVLFEREEVLMVEPMDPDKSMGIFSFLTE